MAYPFNQNEEEMKLYLQALVQDSEELLGETEKDTRTNVISVRNKLKLNIATIKYRIYIVEQSIREKAKATDIYVHENPWKSMGFASLFSLGVGFIFGFIVGKEKQK
jgi:ElaB/YqjD/DUF883 family membrane-anchored ribosome-binding protein